MKMFSRQFPVQSSAREKQKVMTGLQYIGEDEDDMGCLVLISPAKTEARCRAGIAAITALYALVRPHRRGRV